MARKLNYYYRVLDLITHGLKSVLHLLEHTLNVTGKLLNIFGLLRFGLLLACLISPRSLFCRLRHSFRGGFVRHNAFKKAFFKCFPKKSLLTNQICRAREPRQHTTKICQLLLKCKVEIFFNLFKNVGAFKNKVFENNFSLL
jgi:hypothetical protein